MTISDLNFVIKTNLIEIFMLNMQFAKLKITHTQEKSLCIFFMKFM